MDTSKRRRPSEGNTDAREQGSLSWESIEAGVANAKGLWPVCKGKSSAVISWEVNGTGAREACCKSS